MVLGVSREPEGLVPPSGWATSPQSRLSFLFLPLLFMTSTASAAPDLDGLPGLVIYRHKRPEYQFTPGGHPG